MFLLSGLGIHVWLLSFSGSGIFVTSTAAYQRAGVVPYFSLPFFPDLAVGNIETAEGDQRALEELQVQLMNRKVWMASSIHKGEEKGKFLDV